VALVLWIGHVPRGLAITQEIAIAHLAEWGADSLDIFLVGLDAHGFRGRNRRCEGEPLPAQGLEALIRFLPRTL
jgi:hypothetical protein